MNKTFYLILFCLTLIATSCDRKQCTNTNPIFDTHEYHEEAYKKELAKQIETIGLENLRTWLADYIEKDGKTYLVFYIQNNELCAKAMVTMISWDEKMQHVIDRKGKGRVHAEFTNLKFETITTKNGKTEFIYQSFDRLLD